MFRDCDYNLLNTIPDRARLLSSPLYYAFERGPRRYSFASRNWPPKNFLLIYISNIINMTGRGGGGRKTLLAPIHFIFNLLQKRLTVSVWLYENLTTRIEGKIRVS